MTLGQQLPDHNTSRTTTACATSCILRHRRQHHRRDHTITETTPSQRPCHRRDNTIAEAMPSQRPHHRRDLTIAETTRAQSTLRTRIQGPGHPSQITVDQMRPQGQHHRREHHLGTAHLAEKIQGPEQPMQTTLDHSNATNALGTSQRAPHNMEPPQGASVSKGGKDVAHSYLLEPTRPARHFYSPARSSHCTCQNLP